MSTVSFKKGKFREGGLHLPSLNLTGTSRYVVSFTSSCLYVPANWENDTNKLCGFTLGLLPKRAPSNSTYAVGDWKGWLFPIHYDSVRISWAPEATNHGTQEAPNWKLSGKIELFLYTYQQGVRQQVSLGLVDTNEEVELTVQVTKREIQIFCPEFTQFPKSFVHNFSSHSIGYESDPYMGGTAPAVQDLEFELERS